MCKRVVAGERYGHLPLIVSGDSGTIQRKINMAAATDNPNLDDLPDDQQGLI